MTINTTAAHQAIDDLQAAAEDVLDRAVNRPARYTVATGDTLADLAASFGLPPHKIQEWNGAAISPGQMLSLFKPERPKTLFGCNNEDSMATTISRFGAPGIVKLFDGGSGILPDVARIVPSKRGQACFKPNMTDLAAGRLNAYLASYIAKQLETGVQELIITPWQEPNGELKSGALSLATYRAGCLQVAKVIQRDGEKGKVFLGQTFTAHQPRNGTDVPDSWWLTPDQVGGIEWARACIDNYNNPAGAKGGDPYATPYATPEQVSGAAYDQVVRLGYGANYGVSEWNAPWRKNLPDADHSKRLAFFEAHVKWWLARPFPPKHMMIWTGKGVQFDQTLTTAAEVDFVRKMLAA